MYVGITNYLFLVSGENLVPKPSRQSQTPPGSRAGEAENGITFPAPAPLVPASLAGLLSSGGPPAGVIVRSATPHGPSRPHSAAAPTHGVPARCDPISQPPHVLIKTLKQFSLCQISDVSVL